MEHLDTFLSRQPPFDGLAPDEVRQLANQAVEQRYETGQQVLVEDGPPAGALWVILTGSMDIVHEGETIQVLEPGECFGHPSLLSGMAPAFTVRAREPSTCAVFDAEAGRRLLGTRAGATYVATSMRKRLTTAGHTVHGLLDVGTTPVSAIMRPPTYCDPDEPLRDAARRLGRDGVLALLVTLGPGEFGLITDAEVRAAVAADGVSIDAPVRDLARTPVPTVPVGQLAVEATIDMLAAQTEHVAVLDGQRVCGVLAAADLLGLDTRSPIALAAHDPSGGRRGRAGSHRHASAEAVPDVDAGRSPFARSRARAHAPARRGHRAAARLLDLAPRRGPERVGMARARERGPQRVHARLRSGQRLRLRRSRARTGGRDRRVLRATRRRGQRRPRPLRNRGRQQRGPRRQATVADVEEQLAADVRRMPRDPRRVAPDPRDGRIRLPAHGRRAEPGRGAHRHGSGPRASIRASCA